jgi:hypothetical protein
MLSGGLAIPQLVHLHLFRCRCNRQKKQETFAQMKVQRRSLAELRRIQSFEIAAPPRFPAPKRENFLYGDSVFMKGSSQPPPPPPRQPSATNATRLAWLRAELRRVRKLRSAFVDSEALHGCVQRYRRKSLIQRLRSEISSLRSREAEDMSTPNCRAKASEEPSRVPVSRCSRPNKASSVWLQPSAVPQSLLSERAKGGRARARAALGRNTKEAIVAAAAYRRRRAAAARAARDPPPAPTVREKIARPDTDEGMPALWNLATLALEMARSDDPAAITSSWRAAPLIDAPLDDDSIAHADGAGSGGSEVVVCVGAPCNIVTERSTVLCDDVV